MSKLNVKEEPEAPDSPPRRPSGVAICRFFAQGLCRNGANCRFSHGETKASAQAPALSAETSLLLRRLETGELPMYALDVECVATGKTHNDRAVAQIGLVDAYGRCVLNVLRQAEKEVVSYLTPLTGLTAALIDERGVPLEEAIRVLRSSRLPSSAALVGTNIGQDAKWLGLTAPGDCALLVDLAALFRAWDGSRARLLLARPLREGLVGSCPTAERRPRRRRGCCCEYGSPGLLYEDARFRQSAVPCAGVGDAARPLVCREASLVRGRVSGESAALYLWRAALLVRSLSDDASSCR